MCEFLTCEHPVQSRYTSTVSLCHVPSCDLTQREEWQEKGASQQYSVASRHSVHVACCGGECIGSPNEEADCSTGVCVCVCVCVHVCVHVHVCDKNASERSSTHSVNLLHLFLHLYHHFQTSSVHLSSVVREKEGEKRKGGRREKGG